MHPSQSPTASRGDPVLQPAYFTSSLYVEAFRDDISSLIRDFYSIFTHSTGSDPFTLFKHLWVGLGWPYMHFKVLDSRSREKFLHVTLRLFLERTAETEHTFTRVSALFALYVFFYTQPKDCAPPLYAVEHIPIPFDLLNVLLRLPEALSASEDLISLRKPTLHILKFLVDSQVFYILPTSNFGSQNPRTLPREVVTEPAAAENTQQKKKGRPSKRSKVTKAKQAVDELNTWLKRSPMEVEPPKISLYQYQSHKIHLLNAIEPQGFSAIQIANEQVYERLKNATEADNGDQASLQRLERAVEGLKTEQGRQHGGLLGLLEGAGLEYK